MKAPRLLAALALVAGSLASTRAEAGDKGVKFLPFMGPQLEASRYSPADEEFAWVGWIGATADLVEAGRFTAYFNPNVETVLGHRVRSFEAVQANYSLEIGGRYDVGRGRVSGFLHHVSRHVQDRDKRQAVDWNFLGARYESPWPAKWGRRGAFGVSFAVATLASAVEYNWEARVSADIDVVRRGNRAAYLLADVRHVGAAATVDFPRDSITDVRAEAGFRHWQERTQFALFVAYEHRSDATIPRALVIDRALFGFRMRGQRREAPATPPLP